MTPIVIVSDVILLGVLSCVLLVFVHSAWSKFYVLISLWFSPSLVCVSVPVTGYQALAAAPPMLSGWDNVGNVPPPPCHPLCTLCASPSPVQIHCCACHGYCDSQGSEFLTSNLPGHWIQFSRNSNVFWVWVTLKYCCIWYAVLKNCSGVGKFLSHVRWATWFYDGGVLGKTEQLRNLDHWFSCLKLLLRYIPYLGKTITWAFWPQDLCLLDMIKNL